MSKSSVLSTIPQFAPEPKKWIKVSRQGYLTERRAVLPGPGVWIRSDRVVGDFQHTIESVAVDGTMLKPRDCFCGYDRHMAWERAVQLAKR